MTRTITVYTKTACVQCRGVERWLDKRGIEYVTEDATELENLAALKALDYMQAPVTFISNGDPETDIHFGGFNPDLLAKYCTEEP